MANALGQIEAMKIKIDTINKKIGEKKQQDEKFKGDADARFTAIKNLIAKIKSGFDKFQPFIAAFTDMKAQNVEQQKKINSNR